jgi:hypothetical protein
MKETRSRDAIQLPATDIKRASKRRKGPILPAAKASTNGKAQQQRKPATKRSQQQREVEATQLAAEQADQLQEDQSAMEDEGEAAALHTAECTPNRPSIINMGMFNNMPIGGAPSNELAMMQMQMQCKMAEEANKRLQLEVELARLKAGSPQQVQPLGEAVKKSVASAGARTKLSAKNATEYEEMAPFDYSRNSRSDVEQQLRPLTLCAKPRLLCFSST